MTNFKHISLLSYCRRPTMCLMILLLSYNSIGEGNEYNLKAMFVLNFIKYVEWPQSSNSIFTIAIVGESPLKENLLSMVSLKSNSVGPKIEIITVERNELKQCHILFIPAGKKMEEKDVVKFCQGKGILIITEGSKLTCNGAAINLLKLDNKIRFEIYQTQAKIAGVKIASKLLELATTVYP